MRTVRFPIAGLMVAVLIVALGLAALRNSSAKWAGMTFLLTCAVLCLAIVGIVCDVSARRAWWLGFALFGWGYLLLAFWSSVKLPTMALLDAIGERFGLSVQLSGGMGGGMRSAGLWGTALFGGFGGFGGPGNQSIIQISHCLLALLAALIGGVAASRQIWLGVALFGVGYMYSIRDGLLLITSEESATPVYEDPFLIVGHCLLALFAAGIGGFVAPLVSGMRREPAA